MADAEQTTKIDELEAAIQQANDITADIESDVKQQKQQSKDLIIENVDLDGLNEERLEQFAEKPYKILPKSENEAYIVVPRFIPFNVGWLHDQDEAWNVFVVNKYVDWITELPNDIRDRVGIEKKYEQAQVEDRIAEFASKDERDQAWDDLGGQDGGLYRREGDTKLQIKKGNEFKVIAELIEAGNLPSLHSLLRTMMFVGIGVISNSEITSNAHGRNSSRPGWLASTGALVPGRRSSHSMPVTGSEGRS